MVAAKSMFWPQSETELAALALALGARDVSGWTDAEEALVRGLPVAPKAHVAEALAQIRSGNDPLGDTFCTLRNSVERRSSGATYTPSPIVSAMTAWATTHGPIARVVDPGAGSGRFSVSAGRALARAELIAVETDPMAALLARAHLAAAGLASRASVRVEDYRTLSLPPSAKGRTLFVGNPPYVRHHLLGSQWKTWLTTTARSHGLTASQLAGLHVHFFLATLEHARPGDLGVFVTASEWLDVNYGQVVRDLLLGGLGGRSVHIVDPKAMPFLDRFLRAAFEDGFPVPDGVLDAAAAFARRRQGPLLVCCAAGVSRSAAVAYAILRAEGRAGHDAALRAVSCANGRPLPATLRSAEVWADALAAGGGPPGWVLYGGDGR